MEPETFIVSLDYYNAEVENTAGAFGVKSEAFNTKMHSLVQEVIDDDGRVDSTLIIMHGLRTGLLTGNELLMLASMGVLKAVEPDPKDLFEDLFGIGAE